MPKKWSRVSCTDIEHSQTEAQSIYKECRGWLKNTEISSDADYNGYESITKVIQDAQDARWEGMLKGPIDAYRRPLVDAWKRRSRHPVTNSEELSGILLGESITQDDKPTSHIVKVANVAHHVLTSQVTGFCIKKVLKSNLGFSVNSVAQHPAGVVLAGCAVPGRLHQERKSVRKSDTAYDAYIDQITTFGIEEAGLLSFYYFDPRFLSSVFHEMSLNEKTALATIKAGLLSVSNNYFSAFKSISSHDGSWLAGLTGAGASFGIGIAAAAIFGAAVATGGMPILALGAASALGFLATKLTGKVYQAVHNEIHMHTAGHKLTSGELASSFSMTSDYSNHFFYQCPVCHTLYMTPLNEDINDEKAFIRSKFKGDTRCMVCNALYTILESYRGHLKGKGPKTVDLYNKLSGIFESSRKLKKISYFDIMHKSVPVMLGATGGTAGGFDPALFVDTLFRYKLCYLFPDNPGYDLAPHAVSGGDYYRRGGIFSMYSPFAIHYMNLRKNPDLYEVMYRIVQYITFPLPVELAVDIPFWGGAHMASSPNEYSKGVKTYWNREIFEGAAEVRKYSKPIIIPHVKKRLSSETPIIRIQKNQVNGIFKEDIKKLAPGESKIMSYNDWKTRSKLDWKHPRKKIIPVDSALEKYWKFCKEITSANLNEKFREYTMETFNDRLQCRIKDLQIIYTKNINNLKLVQQKIEDWKYHHNDYERNPRWKAVKLLDDQVGDENRRLEAIDNFDECLKTLSRDTSSPDTSSPVRTRKTTLPVRWDPFGIVKWCPKCEKKCKAKEAVCTGCGFIFG